MSERPPTRFATLKDVWRAFPFPDVNPLYDEDHPDEPFLFIPLDSIWRKGGVITVRGRRGTQVFLAFYTKAQFENWRLANPVPNPEISQEEDRARVAEMLLVLKDRGINPRTLR